ncbi:unnamed protein product [Colias eurytheme]|nr:unnamed protein product [Colias eurytheme]
MHAAMAACLSERKKQIQKMMAQPIPEEERAAIEEARSTPLPPMDTPLRRPRSASDEHEAENARPRKRLNPEVRTYATAAGSSPPPAGDQPPPTTQGITTAATTKKDKYPPIVVDELPNWASHFKELKKLLGRNPSARPYGKGIRFMPEDGDEFRCIQNYLGGLSDIAWHAYTPPQERSLKVAIRGLPSQTTPEEIVEAFNELGHKAEYARHIRARKGRPCCIFFAIIKREADTTPAIQGVPKLNVKPKRGDRIDCNHHEKNLKKNLSHAF